MNDRQIQLVQQTFRTIEKDTPAVGTLFYHRMFEIDPSLQSLFKGDIRQQASMLLTSIGMAVKSLSAGDTLTAAMHDLGSRHIGYGVQPTDYDTFSAALMWTLEQSLADEWTPEVHQAWITTFETIRIGMKRATQ